MQKCIAKRDEGIRYSKTLGQISKRSACYKIETLRSEGEMALAKRPCFREKLYLEKSLFCLSYNNM